MPDRDCWSGELEALLTKFRVADAAPLVCGVNVTVKGRLCPAPMATGSDSPLTTNSALVLETDETVTGAPVAFKAPLRAEFVPTTTLLKFKLPGETESCPGAVPVPAKATTVGELLASEVTVRLPEADPAAVGANVTVKTLL